MSMIIYYGVTDTGNIRPKNEDVFYVSEACHFCLVADGMGGAAAGEVASRIFADTVKSVFDGHDAVSEEDTITRVQTAFTMANDKILKHVERNPHSKGMGCTAELLAFSKKSFIVGHVGDSRTYRLRNNSLKQLTKDHSLVQDKLDRGLITEIEARRHAMRNVVLKAVGVNNTVTPDILKGTRNPGDLFLLCSDGLTDMIEDSAVLAVLASEGTLIDKSNKLVQLAKAEGGKDNITVVLSAILK